MPAYMDLTKSLDQLRYEAAPVEYGAEALRFSQPDPTCDALKLCIV